MWQYRYRQSSSGLCIETSTCQAGQFLRPNGEDGVTMSCLLEVSNFEPAVSIILKNLVSK